MKITIIGGGPGGYEAAVYAAKRGAEVVVVEKDKVGGTCLNRGCIPTKAFLAASDVFDAVLEAEEFGLNGVGKPVVDYPAIVARKNKIVGDLVKGIQFLFKSNGVELKEGFGSLVDANTVKVTKSDGSEELLKTDYIILATGSVPISPGVFQYNGRNVITSDEILDFTEVPESLIVVGGGVIGCEIGQYLSKMGSEVTIVEALPRLMATMDDDVSKAIERQFKKDKVTVITGDGVTAVDPQADVVNMTLASGKTLSAKYVLVAVGRAAFTKGLDIENAGVTGDERGRIVVNEYLQTSAPNIYAIGDIIPTAQLAHVASKEGFAAVDNIFGANKPMTYHAIPGAVFTNPQLASVGTMEFQLQAAGKELGKDYKTGTFEFRALGKARASGHLTGFVKVIVDADDVLIGAEIVGANASDMLQVLTTAVQLKLTSEEVLESIFPHPTMCEAIMEALHDIHGLSVNKG